MHTLSVYWRSEGSKIWSMYVSLARNTQHWYWIATERFTVAIEAALVSVCVNLLGVVARVAHGELDWFWTSSDKVTT